MIQLLPHLENYQHIIFDYNGTLIFDTDWCVDCLSVLMIEEGLKPLTTKEYREKFYFPVESFYRDIGFDFNKTPFAELGKRYHNLYLARIDKMHLYQGVRSLLKELRSQGKQVSILTALKEDILLEQLNFFNILDQFHFTYGLRDIHAKSKVDRGHQLMKDSKSDPKRTIIIGDTTHDAEVASALGCSSILLADGHQTEDRQKASGLKTLILDLNRTPDLTK